MCRKLQTLSASLLPSSPAMLRPNGNEWQLTQVTFLEDTYFAADILPSSIQIWIHRPNWIRIRSKSAILYSVLTCVSDPDSAFQAEYRSRSGSRVLWPKNEKNLQLKIFLNKFGTKNYNWPIPRPPYRKSKLQKNGLKMRSFCPKICYTANYYLLHVIFYIYSNNLEN